MNVSNLDKLDFPPGDEACNLGGYDPQATPPGYFDPPPVVLDDPRDPNEGRLNPALRDAARTRDPVQILCRAAVTRFLARPPFPQLPGLPTGSLQLATALADLA